MNFRAKADEAAAQLRSEAWAVLVSFPLGLEVWIVGGEEARPIVEPCAPPVFTCAELGRIFAHTASPSAFRAICAAKRSLGVRIERVEREVDRPATLPPADGPQPLRDRIT